MNCRLGVWPSRCELSCIVIGLFLTVFGMGFTTAAFWLGVF